MDNPKDFFLEVTRRVFSNWTALRLAVEHGMGPKKYAVQFCQQITDLINMNEKLDSSDIATELEEYMDTYFSTELEDNSSIQVADELLRFHRYCLERNEVIATEELARLPPTQHWISKPESVGEKNKQLLTIQSKFGSSNDEVNDNRMDTVDEKWFQVETRRKKNTCPQPTLTDYHAIGWKWSRPKFAKSAF